MAAWLQGAGARVLSLVVETPAGYALFLAVVWGAIFLVLWGLLALGRPPTRRPMAEALRGEAAGVPARAGRSRDAPAATDQGFLPARPRGW